MILQPTADDPEKDLFDSSFSYLLFLLLFAHFHQNTRIQTVAGKVEFLLLKPFHCACVLISFA